MGIIIKSGSVSFFGGILLSLNDALILDWGLVSESLTEGSETYGLITQNVTSDDD